MKTRKPYSEETRKKMAVALEKARAVRKAKDALLTPEELRIKNQKIIRKTAASRKATVNKASKAIMEALKANAPVETIGALYDSLHAKGNHVSTPGKRIFWNGQESLAVAKATAGLMSKQNIHFVPEKGDKVGRSITLDCIREAQYTAIPKDRRRTNIAWGGLNEIFWEFIRHELTELQRQKRTAEILNTPTAKAEPAAPQPTSATPKPAQPREAPAGSIDAIIEARLKALISPLEDLFTEELSRLEKVIDGLRADIAANAAPSAYVAPAKVNLPKVGIFGALPDQFQAVQTKAIEAGLQIDLRYFPKDQSQPDINVAWAIMFKFVNHAVDAKITQAGIPHSNRAFIQGGVTGVVRQLEAWFSNE